MTNTQITNLETQCRQIADKGKDIFHWIWDDRFDAVIATISPKETKPARAILESHLSGFWDYRQIHMAPHKIRRIAELVGGIGEGQVVCSSDPSLDIVIIGIWWPWSNGSNISLRIGLVPLNGATDQTELDAGLKNWFAV